MNSGVAVRIWLVALLVALAPLAQGEEVPLTGPELAEFLGPVSPGAMRWSRSYGADFIIYQGEAVPPLAGRAGFYLGGWPSFKPEPGSTKVTGRLGIFRVKWYRHADATGAITQRGLVQMDYYWKADVWVDAARQSEVDALVAILAQLPTFTHKPAPLPGVPQTALEYNAVPITAVVVLVIEVALTLAGAWTIGRRCLQRVWAKRPDSSSTASASSG